jgi:hypothetical protein
LGLIKNVDQQLLQSFSYILTFVLGVGASFAAWFSGEVLGVLLNKYSEQNTELQDEYKKDIEQYQKTARKFWNELKEQNRQERTAEREQTQNRYEPVRTQEPGQKEPRIHRTVRTTGQNQKVLAVFSELDGIYTEQNRIPGSTELLEILQNKYPELGFASKGYVSDIINKKWIPSRQKIDPESKGE